MNFSKFSITLYTSAVLGAFPLFAQNSSELSVELWKLKPIKNLQGLQKEGIAKRPADSVMKTSGASVVLKGNHLGVRLRGFVIAPVTGLYRFYVAGDDNCALWLSGDDTPFAKTKIAYSNRGLKLREWGKRKSQQSRLLKLKAGEKYYIEAQLNQLRGVGHVSIAWEYRAEGLKNWALEKGVVASQSSTKKGGGASRAIDGNVANDFHKGKSVTHTTGDNNLDSWWKVDLKENRQIENVVIYNRKKYSKRLSNYKVSVINSAGEVVALKKFHEKTGHTKVKENWVLEKPVQGQTVKIESLGKNRQGNRILSLAEVEVVASDVEGKRIRDLSTDKIEQIPAKYLSAYVKPSTDSNDNGLLDTLEDKFGILPNEKSDMSSGKFGEYGDFDGDGIDNRTEIEQGRNPGVSEKKLSYLAKRKFADSLELTHKAVDLLKDVKIPAYKAVAKVGFNDVKEGHRLWRLETQDLPMLDKLELSDTERKEAERLLDIISYTRISMEYRSKEYTDKQIEEAKVKFKVVTGNSILARALLLNYNDRNWARKANSFNAIIRHKQFKEFEGFTQYRLLKNRDGALAMLGKKPTRKEAFAALNRALEHPDAFAPKYHHYLTAIIQNEVCRAQTVVMNYPHEVNELLNNEDLSPAVLNHLRGCLLITEAWLVRGNGWANGVKKEQWLVFENKIEEARTLLTESFDDQKCYLSATQLVTVCMADGKQSGEFWLEKVLELNNDDPITFSNYVYSATPKWGGSLAEMYLAGVRAAASERYDTDLPLRFFQALSQFKVYSKMSLSEMRKSEFSAQCVEVCEGYVKHTKDPLKLDAYLYDLARLYWLNGDYEKSRKSFVLVSGGNDYYKLPIDGLRLPGLQTVYNFVSFGEHTEEYEKIYGLVRREGYTLKVGRLAKDLLDRTKGKHGQLAPTPLATLKKAVKVLEKEQAKLK